LDVALFKLTYPVSEKYKRILLIEVDGNYPEILMAEAEKIMNVVEQFDIDEVLFADTEEQKKCLWKMREVLPEA
jgi:glycolate oxidase